MDNVVFRLPSNFSDYFEFSISDFRPPNIGDLVTLKPGPRLTYRRVDSDLKKSASKEERDLFNTWKIVDIISNSRKPIEINYFNLDQVAFQVFVASKDIYIFALE
jgi:hypothetical protein